MHILEWVVELKCRFCFCFCQCYEVQILEWNVEFKFVKVGYLD